MIQKVRFIRFQILFHSFTAIFLFIITLQTTWADNKQVTGIITDFEPMTKIIKIRPNKPLPHLNMDVLYQGKEIGEFLSPQPFNDILVGVFKSNDMISIIKIGMTITLRLQNETLPIEASVEEAPTKTIKNQLSNAKITTYGMKLLGNHVIKVLPDSPAEKAGIAPGDVVVTINGKTTTTLPNDKALWLQGTTQTKLNINGKIIELTPASVNMQVLTYTSPHQTVWRNLVNDTALAPNEIVSLTREPITLNNVHYYTKSDKGSTYWGVVFDYDAPPLSSLQIFAVLQDWRGNPIGLFVLSQPHITSQTYNLSENINDSKTLSYILDDSGELHQQPFTPKLTSQVMGCKLYFSGNTSDTHFPEEDQNLGTQVAHLEKAFYWFGQAKAARNDKNRKETKRLSQKAVDLVSNLSSPRLLAKYSTQIHDIKDLLWDIQLDESTR